MTIRLDMKRITAEDIPQPLRTRLEQLGDTVVVVASGEIDLTHSERLRTQLFGLVEGFPRVVLDLREVGFIDSSGLHCILDVDSASRAAGVEFALVPGPRQVQRLFEVTRTEEQLYFVDDVDELL
jgi:anti-sigma B factor antagonist